MSLVRHEVVTWAESDEFEDLQDLMSDVPSGGNHGRKSTDRRPMTSPEHDGERWGDSRRSLDAETHAKVQFVATGGAQVVTEDWVHFHGGVTHLDPCDSTRTLTRSELGKLDAARVRAAALAELGFTEDDMALLDRPGAMTAERRALYARFEDRLLEVQEAGGRMTDLARALGWYVRGAGSCGRMRKALARARKRRETGEELPPPPASPATRKEPGPAPTGLCECGCGGQTPLARRTRNGLVKGAPTRFVPGHTRQFRKRPRHAAAAAA